MRRWAILALVLAVGVVFAATGGRTPVVAAPSDPHDPAKLMQIDPVRNQTIPDGTRQSPPPPGLDVGYILQAITPGYGPYGPNGWGSYSMGYRFTPYQSGAVTQLGRYRGSYSESSTIKLWDASTGALLATATVSGTNWSYVNITPVMLTVGREYWVSTYGGSNVYYEGLSYYPYSVNGVTVLYGGYYYGDGMPNNNAGNTIYGMPDIYFGAGAAYDVAPTAILSPPPACSLGPYIPSARIKNMGTSAQPSSFYVKYWATGPGTYVDSALCPALLPDSEATVTFATWNITAKGGYTVRCSTMSAADSVRADDKITTLVRAGLTKVLFLTAEVPQYVKALADSIMNKFPNDFVIDTMDVGYYYNRAAPNVDSLIAQKYKACVTWANYGYMNATALGESLANYLERGGGGVAWAPFGTQYSLGRFSTVYSPVTSGGTNYGTVTMGTVHLPAHKIMDSITSISVGAYSNYGSTLSHSTAYKVVDWSDGQILAACNDTANRRAALLGFFPTGFNYTTHSGDWLRFIRNMLVWLSQNNDVGVSKIIAPTGDIDSGATVTPACSVFNYGPQAEGPFKVRLRIGSYRDSATVATLASREAAYVTFADWTATLRGTFSMSCSTELTIDSKQANDKMGGSGYIHVRDVAPTSLGSPKGNYASGAVVIPGGTWKNNGNRAATFEAWMVLYRPGGARYYASKTNVPGLVPGGTMQIGSFAPCTLRIAGTWTVRCSSYLATGDMVSGNDFFDSTFTVTGGTVEGGWLAKSAMPLAPGGKDMKDGAWLAYNAGDGLVYAAKGNKQGDFYSYDPVANTWTQRLSWPTGRDAKGPYVGAAAVSDGAGKVYATKGNNTQGFWLYDAALNTWTQKANVPLGPTNKKVKNGADLAYYDGLVYLLKGYKDEFWRYNPASDSWYQLPNAPTGVSAKWDKGSWLANDGAGKLYAHKAKYHEFYSFDIAAGAWGPTLPAMPIASYTGKSKKSKDGGAGAYADGAIYAFKGGNTQELWKYDVAGNAWTEKETIPQMIPNSTKKKKVKGGADIVAVGPVFFATKGNKAPNIWQYTPGMFSYEPRVGREGIAAGTTVPGTTLLSVSPNPMAGGFVTVSFNLPRTTSATLSVRDLTGRTVASQLVSGRSGTVGLDLRHLSTGVYMVELISGGVTATQKLVVQH